VTIAFATTPPPSTRSRPPDSSARVTLTAANAAPGKMSSTAVAANAAPQGTRGIEPPNGRVGFPASLPHTLGKVTRFVAADTGAHSTWR
jgi:hypothetical protein